MLNKLFIKFIRLYQLAISPFLGASCRFHPTCSEYAIEVFRTQPLHKAIYLTAKRISKCHPLGPHGVDLPPKKQDECSKR